MPLLEVEGLTTQFSTQEGVVKAVGGFILPRRGRNPWHQMNSEPPTGVIIVGKVQGLRLADGWHTTVRRLHLSGLRLT
jgi:ABC-type antimicrobial peptide transport system ATPase subunit